MIKYVFGALVVITVILLSVLAYITWMPRPQLESYADEIEISGLLERLKTHVERLSISKIGRNQIQQDNLTPARVYIANEFSALGYEVKYQNYELYGHEFSNIIVDIDSVDHTSPVLIVGAHYDSVPGSPGANDNASGVAALLEVARYLKNIEETKYRIRLIAFANEEPPYFQTEEMGSAVYVKSMTESEEQILGMISIETIGYYTNREGSQTYPKLFHLLYPDQGNFVSFIGNLQSRELVTSSISIFRKNCRVPSEGIASPAFIPGVGWSDHWSFWVSGHKAIMITDTAPYRYPHYHKASDTPDKLNYDQYSRVVHGLFKVVEGIAKNGL